MPDFCGASSGGRPCAVSSRGAREGGAAPPSSAGGVDEQGTRRRADVGLAGEAELPAGLDGGGGQPLGAGGRAGGGAQPLGDGELAGEDDAGALLQRLGQRSESDGWGPRALGGGQSGLGV